MTDYVRYYDADASGANDGTSEANAWQDMNVAASGSNALTASMVAGDTFVLNFKRSATAAAQTVAKSFTNSHPIGSTVLFRGYETTPGDAEGVRANRFVYGERLQFNNTNDGYFLGRDINVEGATNPSSAGALSVLDGNLVDCDGINAYQGPGIKVADGVLWRCVGECTSGTPPTSMLRAGIEGTRAQIRDCIGIAGIAFDCSFRGNSVAGCLAIPKRVGVDIASRHGIYVTTGDSGVGWSITNCTIYGFAGSGIGIQDAGVHDDAGELVSGNLIWDCDRYAIECEDDNATGRGSAAIIVGNAFGGCTLGNLGGETPLLVSPNTELSADPFEDAAGNNFAVNEAAGGGAAVRAAALGDFFSLGTDAQRIAGYWQRAGGGGSTPKASIY